MIMKQMGQAKGLRIPSSSMRLARSTFRQAMKPSIAETDAWLSAARAFQGIQGS